MGRPRPRERANDRRSDQTTVYAARCVGSKRRWEHPLAIEYDGDAVERWIEITERQRAKDRLFVERVERYLRPGSILEIGAGCGQLSQFLRERGHDALATDLSQAFVDYMLSRGMPAARVDALDIRRYIEQPVDNIVAQGLSTLVSRDLRMVERTYRACYAALRPRGRMLWIFPNAYGSKKWSSVSQHREIISKVGFAKVAEFRDQIMPARFYETLPRSVAYWIETLPGRFFGIRSIFVLEKPGDAGHVAV